jgi:hypothetical protein
MTQTQTKQDVKQPDAIVRRRKVDMSEAVVVTDPSGKTARQIIFPVRMSKDDKGLVKLMSEKVQTPQGEKWVPVFIPSAFTYSRAAAACGLITRPAETVVIDGKEMPNGSRNPTTGAICYRYQCAGYTPTGQLYMTDRSVAYDVKLYNLIDMVAKAKNKKMKWGMPGTTPSKAKIPAEMNKAEGLANWLVACSVIDSEVVTRVTMMAVASDKNKAGICATRPSPMVNKT